MEAHETGYILMAPLQNVEETHLSRWLVFFLSARFKNCLEILLESKSCLLLHRVEHSRQTLAGLLFSWPPISCLPRQWQFSVTDGGPCKAGHSFFHPSQSHSRKYFARHRGDMRGLHSLALGSYWQLVVQSIPALNWKGLFCKAPFNQFCGS